MNNNAELTARIRAARILVVDDDVDMLDLVETVLGKRGYTNVYVASDSTAVAKMFELAPCDLVLLDMDMPGMNGLSVMRQVREGLKGGDYMPVIVVSARDDLASRLMAWREGARDYITKPFNTGEFLQRIHNQLEVRMLFKAKS